MCPDGRIHLRLRIFVKNNWMAALGGFQDE
jgi:hypothetical protein